jgi:cold-inducible RNA-binding protein
VAVRLFVGNMPYGATEADLRTHFSAVGQPSQVVLPVDRETGRPRGFAFVEFLERAHAEAAIQRFNQQPFMGRPLSVSEARPREAGGGGGGFRPGGPPGGGFSGGRPPGAGFSGPRPGGAGPGGFRSGPPMGGPPGKNFGPPKKKSNSSEKRWENKERGPRGPIKERYSGRMDGLYDTDEDTTPLSADFDDVASRAAKEAEAAEAAEAAGAAAEAKEDKDGNE